MSHEKRHLPKPTILSKTRYIGFTRQPVRDNERDNFVTTEKADSKYPLRDGNRWVDMEKKP